MDYKTGRPAAGGGGGGGDDLVLRLYMLGAREAWRIEPRGATLVHILDGDTRGVHPDAGDDARWSRRSARRRRGSPPRRFEPAPVVGVPQLRLRPHLPGAGPVTAIGSLEAGAPLEGVFAVRRKERRLSRQGKPFLALTLADATGAVPAMVFDEADWFGEQFAEGDRVRVSGRVTERDGRRSVIISHLRAAGDEAEAEDLLPRSHRDPDELFGFVLHLADEVADPGLRAVLDALTGDDDLARAWRTMPCTRSGHHAYMGGLVEHTVGVASVVQALAVWHPRIDADLLLAAALVHDLGHARAFRLGATFELTDEGRLLGHVAIGHEIVGDVARRVGLAAGRRAELLHAMDWHHGPPPGQAPGAASPEALALWRANSLETAVKSRLEGPGPVNP